MLTKHARFPETKVRDLVGVTAPMPRASRVDALLDAVELRFTRTTNGTAHDPDAREDTKPDHIVHT